MRALLLALVLMVSSAGAVPALATGAGRRPAASPGLAAAAAELRPTAPRTDAPPALARAVREAAPVDARVEIASWRGPPACTAETFRLSGRPDRSGRLPVRVEGVDPDGRPCFAWGSVRVRVFVEAWEVTRAVPDGAPLAGAVRRVSHELVSGLRPAGALPPRSVAARALRPGHVLRAHDLRPAGPRAGDTVTVLVVSGDLRIEHHARLVRCRASRPAACAVLPTGRRVQGRLESDRLVVEVSR